jgi:hypothetical protein
MTDVTQQRVLGFKDMHPEQAEALIRFMDHALSVAHEECFPDLLEAAEDVVVLFGGVGIEVKYDVDY